jgi:hypothetical protein
MPLEFRTLLMSLMGLVHDHEENTAVPSGFFEEHHEAAVFGHVSRWGVVIRSSFASCKPMGKWERV